MRRRSAFLMPVFDPEAGELERTMASMLAQSEPADVVIVDDGSARPVEELLEPCENVAALRLDRNQGIVAALNHGLAYIAGRGYDYAARMDCGDICAPNRIEVQQAYMDRHPGLDLVGAFADVVDQRGRHLYFEGTSGGREAIRRKLYDNAAFKHPTFFFRTRSVERLGSYSSAYPHAEDYEFMRRALLNGRIDCLDDVLVTYVKSESGISSRNRRRQLLSRLRIQLDYVELTRLAAYLGILRTVVTLLIPVRAWGRVSQLYWRRRNQRQRTLLAR